MVPKNISFFLLLLWLGGHSQVQTGFAEKKWAFFHPFAALKVKKISKKCFAMYDTRKLRVELDSFANGGSLDAFRHGFFMAAFAQKIKAKKIRKLGLAHEKSNYQAFLKSTFENGEVPDSIGTVMDLRNNEFGIALGEQNKRATLEELKNLVINGIKRGEAVILKRNLKGSYLDCDGKVIYLNTTEKRWSNQKCLVASNYRYID